ncbi:hypothetical protein [uncultured Methylobacterium sp.]|uniref:hypothetical protein n=1 Tax=uncultured Methylobacterium sp. TaxID=157278 RepID=UPI00259247BA|nr:hypothetical protein [uncultured Methylobacterium sp.]
MRRAATQVQDLKTSSQELVESGRIATEAATARAERAEAAARDNAHCLGQVRKQARTAEERARLAEERAGLAEERLRLAEERLRLAEAREAEARNWLHRIGDALRGECDGLGDVLATVQASGNCRAA